MRCEACDHDFMPGEKYRTDDDGFIGCLPCFPVSNLPRDANTMMSGRCYGNTRVAKTASLGEIIAAARTALSQGDR